MRDDPRHLLDRAAQQRARCHLLPRGGGVIHGAVVRVERGGVVIGVPPRQVADGTQVKVWFSLDADTWTFSANVLRVRVPVSDRSQEGVLLGYIDRFQKESTAETSAGGRRLDLLPAAGRGVSLLKPPAHLVQLGMDGLTFTLPMASKLVFVENGEMQVVLADKSAGTCAARARVRGLTTVEGALLYDLAWVDVDDADRLRVLVRVLADAD